MEKKATFFFFGFGQSAKYFLKELSKSKKNSIFLRLILLKLATFTLIKKNTYHINLRMIIMTKVYFNL